MGPVLLAFSLFTASQAAESLNDLDRQLEAMKSSLDVGTPEQQDKAVDIYRSASLFQGARGHAIVEKSLKTIIDVTDNRNISNLWNICSASAKLRRELLPRYADNICEISNHAPRLYEMLACIAIEPVKAKDTYQRKASIQIAKLMPDSVAKKDILLQIVLAQPSPVVSRPAANAVLDLIAPSDLPVLRAAAADALKMGRAHTAILVLSHVGDAVLLEEFRHAWEAHGRSHRGEGGIFAKAILKIEAQNPPARLLEHLVNDPPAADRVWMMKRAVALGLDRAKIRQSLLMHLRSRQDPTDRLWMYQRPLILQAAKRLKVLRPGDEAVIPPADQAPAGPSPWHH